MSHNAWTNNFLDGFEDELLPEIEELELGEGVEGYGSESLRGSTEKEG